MSSPVPSQAIKSLGTILAVWAHPDDESWCAAGLMALAVQNGQKVICVTATKGEKGIQDPQRWPPERLGEIRAQELRAGLDILGVQTHHWLGYQDGACNEVPVDEAAGKIKDLMKRYKPNTILTFGPDGLTGHPDHQTVSHWVRAAAQGSGIAVYHAVQLRELYDKMREADDQFNIFFNIDQPLLRQAQDCDLVLALPQDLQEQKYRCLSTMPSQTEAMFRALGHDKVCDMLGQEAFVRAKSDDL